MGNPSVERHRCTDCIVTQVTVAVIVFTDLTSVSVSYASGDGKIKKTIKNKTRKSPHLYLPVTDKNQRRNWI